MFPSRSPLPAAALALGAAVAVPVSAEVILLDFQQNDTTATGYNDINGSANDTTTVFSNLKDSAGNTTDVDLTLTASAGVAKIDNQPTGSQTTFTEANSASDGIRSANSSTDGLITITFSDLEDGSAYDLKLFANSGLFFTADVDYTFGTQTFNGQDPTTPTFLDFDDQIATGGTLVLSIQANGTGNAFARGAAINAARLELVPELVPEPASLALMGLGGLLVLGRTRRA